MLWRSSKPRWWETLRRRLIRRLVHRLEQRITNRAELRIEIHVGANLVAPSALVADWKPRGFDQLGAVAFAAAGTDLSANHRAQPRAPAPVGAVGGLGGSIEEQAVRPYVEA